MWTYTVVYNPKRGYSGMKKWNGHLYQVSFWYTSLARLNRYWGAKNGIRFKSVKDVIYK